MKAEKLAEHIGNIEDSLILEANGGKIVRIQTKTARRWVTVAAAVALMTASMAVGALALQPDPEVVYVDAMQEKVEIGDTGISLIMPKEWEERYEVENNENDGIVVRCKAAAEAWPGAGVLFTVSRIGEQYPVDYEYPQPGYTIAATKENTYALLMASDMQYPPDNEAVAAEYTAMYAQISDIQVLMTDWMKAGSNNSENWQPGTVTVQLLNSEMQITDTVTCDAKDSAAIGDVIGALAFDKQPQSFLSDMMIMLDGEEYYLNSATGQIAPTAGGDKSDRLNSEQLTALVSIIK